jgi:hypothetical protein
LRIIHLNLADTLRHVNLPRHTYETINSALFPPWIHPRQVRPAKSLIVGYKLYQSVPNKGRPKARLPLWQITENGVPVSEKWYVATHKKDMAQKYGEHEFTRVTVQKFWSSCQITNAHAAEPLRVLAAVCKGYFVPRRRHKAYSVRSLQRIGVEWRGFTSDGVTFTARPVDRIDQKYYSTSRNREPPIRSNYHLSLTKL